MALPPFPSKITNVNDKIAIDWFERIRSEVNGFVAGTGAPIGALYLTLSTNATLTSERVLTASTGIKFTDNGAGSTLVISAQEGLQRSWMKM